MAAAASASQPSLSMRSSDLIVKEHLDYGGFGDVYLCYHVTLGQVVLKTMYTGPLRNEENKRSLLEEGNIMASLNHERVVKLLGVIMEDRECSLVMELIPRGNLLAMLERVTVPVSVKGRIILEILEGMVYLTEKLIIHKDIKPDNILVDKDFHIKIADLGLATCQMWTKLTKEESRRKSRMGVTGGERGAGTLSYMAPEHLESIHTVSSEKSDVYSFAIVLWVILTGQEPYANARSEDQISQCVRNGDRPAVDLIPLDTPPEMVQLMTTCWDHSPQLRPTFQEGYSSFQPFYTEKLQPLVEEDLVVLKNLYEGPDELVEKMKSLSMSHDCFSADCPAPLLSSERSVSDPVEASIEDMHRIQYAPSEQSADIQTDARSPCQPPALEEKLERELHYHKHGSYNSEAPHNHDNGGSSGFSARLPAPEQDRPTPVSSVHTWTKGERWATGSQEEARHQPAGGGGSGGLYESMNSSVASPLPTSISSPSLPYLNQQHPHSHYDRQQSWPAYPVSDTGAPGRLAASCKGGSLHDPGALYIQNARGIQIGNNNSMSIRGLDPSNSLSLLSNYSAYYHIKEGIQKYEDRAVTEEHLDLLRDNIGLKWKQCARRLGLSDVEIETIEHDCHLDGLPEMVHQMLERWRMREGTLGCTIGNLCRALEKCIKVDVIQKILDSCGHAS